MAAPPVAETALRLEIEVAQPDGVNSDEARERIEAARPDAVLICAFGGLIREPLLSAHEMLNVHPSLLPRWRGAAPIERAIEAGDEETGVSIMHPVAEMDAGPVCLARAEPIRADDDYGALSTRLRALGGDLLVEALDTRPRCAEQPAHGVTVAEKISTEDRRLGGDAPAAVLERRVRALSPHVGAFVELPGGERLQVLESRVGATEDEARRSPTDATACTETPAPGELGRAGDRLVLGCTDGALELLVVKPAGGRAMDAGAYLRGHGPGAGHPPHPSPQ
jgi:methionyl-tRNA formyltransferase